MKLLKEETTHIGFIGKGSFKKKKVIEFKSERAAKMWLTKNAPKYHDSGIDSVGYMVKDKWDKDPYTEATVNKDMGKAPTIKKSIWDKLHSDYKSVRDGVHYMMYLDKKSGSTIYGPVKIVESISEKKVPKKGSVDFNQHKIAVDTLKNPNKGLFMGGPSAKEAEETLMKKFGYTTQEINKLKESITEAKMSDALFVADQLVNGVDQGHLDKREFISHLSKETNYGKNELGKVFDAWDKLGFREKDDLGFSNREMLQWLKKFGIKEGVKKGK